MELGAVAEMVFLAALCGGCGLLFVGIGLWAKGAKKPVNFWAGKGVRPKTVTDIPAYNRENARMWGVYSIPYFLSAGFGILGIWFSWGGWAVLGLLVLSCTAGIWWLIDTYRKIEKRYTRS